ncbi:MAG TPA: GNAT family N-acetyltransferase [Bacillota bacterium]|nr:GNAT family N-acetyltransferase [Bacillota bacterium]
MNTMIRMASIDDLDSIVKLLKQGKLDIEGIESNIQNFVVIENVENGEILGTAGFEQIDESCGLLRSLALKEEAWSENLVLGLIRILLQLAVKKRIESIYLLTRSTTFFEMLGFEEVDYEDAARLIQQSTHFAQYQPEVSSIMAYQLVDKFRF